MKNPSPSGTRTANTASARARPAHPLPPSSRGTARPSSAWDQAVPSMCVKCSQFASLKTPSAARTAPSSPTAAARHQPSRFRHTAPASPNTGPDSAPQAIHTSGA